MVVTLVAAALAVGALAISAPAGAAPAEGMPSPTKLTAGTSHTCAIVPGGTVKCWGANAFGQLGNGTTIDSPTPITVAGLGGFAVSITAGDNHTCALLVAG